MAILKVYRGRKKAGRPDVVFYCPGCDCDHGVWIKPNKNIHTDSCWSWNGSKDAPTFSPSILVKYGPDGKFVCHSFVKAGKIEYLGDCTHELAGKTIQLPDYDSME